MMKENKESEEISEAEEKIVKTKESFSQTESNFELKKEAKKSFT